MIEAVLAGVFGLVIGSFLNVCIYRLPRDLSVAQPARSFCPSCERTIAWYDNVPLLSYFLLQGKCRFCSWRIPLRYPLVEAATAGFFFAITLALGPTLVALKYCVFAAILVALIAMDLEERILADEFTKGGILLGLGFATLAPIAPGIVTILLADVRPSWLASLAESAFSACALIAILWSIGTLYRHLRRREGLGLGDVKMVGMIGAFLGLGPALLSVAAGSVLGTVFGLLYIFVAKKEAATYELPFGSFLGVAALLVAAWTYPGGSS